MIYLAIPYIGIEELSYRASLGVSAALFNLGELVFSPIAHCHEMAKEHDLPTSYGFWEEYNKHMIDVCAEFGVICLDDWSDSEGVTGELEYAEKQGKPVRFISVEKTRVYSPLPLYNFTDESTGKCIASVLIPCDSRTLEES